jgi:hypothetical protein
MKCSICEREGSSEMMEKHHLYPGKKRRRARGREDEYIWVDKTCGDQIHQMFTNQQLRKELDSVESLRNAMQTYITWIRKKPIEASVTMKRKKRRL